jgi:hypothetical protein
MGDSRSSSPCGYAAAMRLRIYGRRRRATWPHGFWSSLMSRERESREGPRNEARDDALFRGDKSAFPVQNATFSLFRGFPWCRPEVAVPSAAS